MNLRICEFSSHYCKKTCLNNTKLKKADFPSYVGIIEEYSDKTEAMDTSTNGGANGTSDANETAKPGKKYLIDTMSIKAAKANMHVQSYLKDGLIDDWDLFEKVLNYTFGKHLRCDPSKHPILMSEPVVRANAYFIICLV